MRIELHHADSEKMLVTDLALGTAAEHLVCADLLLQGFTAFRADQNCPYDIAVQYGRRLIRIQVKATRVAIPIRGRANPSPAYQWFVRRAGKGGYRRYGVAEFDALALVAIDIRAIAYIHVSESVLQTIHLKPPGSQKGHANRKRGNIDDYPFRDALTHLSNAIG